MEGPVTNDVLLERINVLCAKVDRVAVCLEGDGSPANPGHKVRIDRLEQSESRRTWAFRAVVVAVFGLIVEFVVDLIKK